MQHELESATKDSVKTSAPRTVAPTMGSSEQLSFLQLQQQAGNQAVQELLRSGAIQAKLAISSPDDPEEREADNVAQTIMRSPAGFPISSHCSCGEGEEMCEECQHKQSSATIHRSAIKTSAPAHTPPIVSDVLRSPGSPLDASTRAFFEPRFGRDFSHVRIHTGTEASASARSIYARAYTAGSDIVFGHGQYSPDSILGRTLLAHELAHVARDWQKPLAFRKNEAPLDVDVPDPSASFAPQFKYPWQNPELRKTIYPYRDEELIFFLRTYMEIDLEDPSTPVTPVTAEELTQERARLQKDLAEVSAELKEAQKAKDTAKINELSARSRRLEADLNYLPEPPKKGGISKRIEKKWTAYRYSKMDDKGNELDHDALLNRILDRFDADPGFKRYPKWLRYMVLHFSGMRYQSAHGSYAPAIDLVKRLKREQLNFQLSAAPEIEIAEHSEAAIRELEAELTATDKPTPKRASTIKTRLAVLRAVEKERDAAFSKKGEETKRAAFEELIKLEDERDKLKLELDSQQITDPAITGANQKRLEELKPLIEARESEIGAAPLKAVRKRIEAAEEKRRKAVAEDEIERALQAFSTLDDMQALAVIKAMRAEDAFPEWVWREIVRVTALKLEVTEGSDWETVTEEEKKQKTATDPSTKRWKQIMAGWKADVTGWREKHGSDLSLVVIRAVCNEICEMSLHARGVKPAGGIAQKARWYAKSGAGQSFSRPTKESDLKQGASLFFLVWSYKPPKDAVSIVHSDLGVDLMSENGEIISDGFKGANDRTYHFLKDKSVTRTAPIESTKDPSIKPHEETQYLVWLHEAMVVDVDSAAGRVVTFETGPIGLRTRNVKQVVNQWNVYMGFATSTKEPAEIDEYLKDIVPGRTSKSSSP